jgi:hypothetical protein
MKPPTTKELKRAAITMALAVAIAVPMCLIVVGFSVISRRP